MDDTDRNDSEQPVSKQSSTSTTRLSGRCGSLERRVRSGLVFFRMCRRMLLECKDNIRQQGRGTNDRATVAVIVLQQSFIPGASCGR